MVVWRAIPDAPLRDGPPATIRHGDVLFNPQLLRLNLGVFVLHVCQTAIFVVPTLLVDRGGLPSPEPVAVYLPVVVSFLLMVFPMVIAEKRRAIA